MGTDRKPPRVAKLERIMRSIAMYAVSETYTDEPEAQRHLAAAIRELEEAQKELKVVGESG